MLPVLPFITPALEALVKLFERLRDFDKAEVQNRRTFFKEVIKPLFEKLEPVTKDYIDFFDNAKALITKSTSKRRLQDVFECIQNERKVMAFVRMDVLVFAENIKQKVKDEDFLAFADAIDDFFCSCTGTAKSSRSKQLLSLFRTMDITKEDKQEILKFIDGTLAKLVQSRKIISDTYARIELHTMGSSNLIHRSKGKKRK